MTGRNHLCYLVPILLSLPFLVSGWPLFALLWDKAESNKWVENSIKLSKRDVKHQELDMVTTYFVSQFSNPKAIIAVLLLIGADVVQKAAAQLTGGPHDVFTPVVFSFGWVAYAFNSIAASVGDGTFLPEPDYHCIVVNVDSGDQRENQSWVLGRLLRDLELHVERTSARKELDSGMLVTVYKAAVDPDEKYAAHRPKKDIWWYSFMLGVPVQLGIAAIPCGLRLNWSIIAMTFIGNILAWATMLPPCMRGQKYQGKLHSRATYALTRGNGHKHVFILLPNTRNFEDVEDDAVPKSPLSALPYLDQMASSKHRAHWLTRCLSVFFAACWVVFLIAVAGLETDAWYLFGVGAVGMIHNILISASPRSSKAHGIPLIPVPDDSHGKFGRKKTTPGARRPKVREVLINLEREYPGAGLSLRNIFFNGRPTAEDSTAWDADDVSEQNIKDRRGEKWPMIWPNDPAEVLE